MTQEQPKLLPCPFCGCEAKMSYSGLSCPPFIFCTGCHVKGSYEDVHGVIGKRWNTRHIPQPQPTSPSQLAKEAANKIFAHGLGVTGMPLNKGYIEKEIQLVLNQAIAEHERNRKCKSTYHPPENYDAGDDEYWQGKD